MTKITYTLLAAAVLAITGLAVAKQKTEKAPDFTLKNYDGKEFKLSEYRGTIVVLEWFNYECPFLRYHYEKASTMNDLAEKYKDKNVVWLAINSTAHQKTNENKQFAEENDIQHPILDDRSGKTGKSYGAKTTPHMFIIDAKGNIVYDGAIDNAPLGKTPKDEKLINYVDKALAELTAGDEITIAKTKPYGCSVKYAK